MNLMRRMIRQGWHRVARGKLKLQTIAASALARNYQGLLAKSDPRRDDESCGFALRQTPGRRFHPFSL